MNIDETVKALRWIAANDEIVFNAEQANIAADQLEQLQAENASLRARLEKALVLYCNVGDTVYIADGWGERVQKFKVRKIGIFVDGLVLYYQGEYEQPITPDIWGKTVFLTEAEALAKLEELKGGVDIEKSNNK